MKLSTMKKLFFDMDNVLVDFAPWNNPSAWSDKLNWVKKYLGKATGRNYGLNGKENLGCS